MRTTSLLTTSLLLVLAACGGSDSSGQPTPSAPEGTPAASAPSGDAPSAASAPAPSSSTGSSSGDVTPPPANEPASMDFTLTTPASIRVRRGASQDVEIAITRATGANGAVTVDASGLPTGVQASALVIPDGSDKGTLTLTADALADQKITSMTIHAVLGTVEHTNAPSLTISGKPGEIDATFGASGIADADALGWVADLATLADGRVVAGATAGNEAVLFRFSALGKLDTTFGDQGIARVPHAAGISDELRRVKVLSDGRIVVSGERSLLAANKDLGFAARFDADGHLDSSFGTSGVAAQDGFTGDTSFGAGILEGQDGVLFAAGYAVANGNCSVLLTKLDANGQPVTAFGPNGAKLVPGPDADLCPSESAQLADGSFLLSGTAYQHSRIAVARFSATGELDTNFGTSGFTMIGSESSGAWSGGIAVAPDGKIVVGGQVWGPATTEMTFARLDAGGHLDGTFGAGGLRTVDVGPMRSQANAVRVADDGSVFATGMAEMSANTWRFAAVRLDATGNLDTTWATQGALLAPLSAGTGYSVVLGSDGRLLAGTRFTDTKRPGLLGVWQ